jgi:hypothetical protein
VFDVRKVAFGLQQLSDYNTIADVSTALAHTVTYYFLIQRLYQNIRKSTEHPVLQVC